MAGRSWDVPGPKGGKTLPVPIAPALRSFLGDALRTPGPLLFPQDHGSMRPRHQRLPPMLQAAIARAGVLQG